MGEFRMKKGKGEVLWLYYNLKKKKRLSHVESVTFSIVGDACSRDPTTLIRASLCLTVWLLTLLTLHIMPPNSPQGSSSDKTVWSVLFKSFITFYVFCPCVCALAFMWKSRDNFQSQVIPSTMWVTRTFGASSGLTASECLCLLSHLSDPTQITSAHISETRANVPLRNINN